MPGSQYPTGSFPGSLPPPLGVTPDINFVPSRLNLITQVACIAVTTIFLFLRFYTKHIVGLGFFAEDWVSLCAWLSCTLYCSLALAIGRLGLGIHMWNITPHKFLKFFEIGYVLEVLNGPVIFTTKLAILLLLIRAFSIKRHFVLATKILLIVMALYYVAITLVKIFICRPVEKFWNPRIPGRCLNTNTIFISDCVMSLITDLIILVSPFSVIWSLRMDLKRKLGSSAALAVGALACIASILRLEASVRTMNNHDKSYIFESIVLYSSGEIAFGVICGCIPVLPALYRHYITKRHTDHSSGRPTTYNTRRTDNSLEGYKDTIPLRILLSSESSHHNLIGNEGKLV